MDKIKEYMAYPSTWKGLVTLLGVIGVTLNPEQAELIATIGVSIVGLIATFFSDSDVK